MVNAKNKKAELRGRIATPVSAFGPQVANRDEAWAALYRALGLSKCPALDGRVKMAPEGRPALEGVVDYLSPNFLDVRTDDGLHRFMHTFDASVGLGTTSSWTASIRRRPRTRGGTGS